MTSCTTTGCNPIGGAGTGTGAIAFGGRKTTAANALCPVSGGGGSGSGTCNSTLTPTQVMYTLDGTGKVLTYAIDATGNLTLMCVTATAAQGELALSTNKFLYVLDPITPQIFAFIIGHSNTGTLTPVASQPFAINDNAFDQTFSHIESDPLGRFIFVTNYNGNLIHVYSVNQGSGALAEVATSPVPVSLPAHLAVDHTGGWVYVPDPIDGDIFIFSLNAAGKLTAGATSPFIIESGQQDFPHFAAFNPLQDKLYTANNSSISSYSASTTDGSLTEIIGSPLDVSSFGVAPVIFAIDSSAKYMYIQDENTNGILGFVVDTANTGVVLQGQVAGSPFGVGSQVFFLTSNPSGAQLFVVVQSTSSDVVNTGQIALGSGTLTLPTTNSKLTAESNLVIANVSGP
ncbi:MAG: beta-propeller fold lactonase family protein [Candidatus Acidiferrales bacterium]